MKTKMLATLLLASGLCSSPGAVQSQNPEHDEEPAMMEPTLQPDREQALVAYVQGRFNRIRESVDRDRAEARRYMSPKLAGWYEAEFNPSVALAEFKACNDCEEFSVTITRMRHELREDDDFGRNEYATNVSYIEFVTVPLAPRAAEPRSMAVKLLWRPRLFIAKGDVPLEIDLEEMLVRRTRVSM